MKSFQKDGHEVLSCRLIEVLCAHSRNKDIKGTKPGLKWMNGED